MGMHRIIGKASCPGGAPGSRSPTTYEGSGFGFWLWLFELIASFPRRNLVFLLMQNMDTCQIPELEQTSGPNFSWFFLFLKPSTAALCLEFPFVYILKVLSTYWRLHVVFVYILKVTSYGVSKMLPLWDLCPVCFLSLTTIGLWQSSKSPGYLRAQLWQMKVGAKGEHLSYFPSEPVQSGCIVRVVSGGTTLPGPWEPRSARRKLFGHPCCVAFRQGQWGGGYSDVQRKASGHWVQPMPKRQSYLEGTPAKNAACAAAQGMEKKSLWSHWI